MVATTLSAAVALTDVQVQVASASGISAEGSFGQTQTTLMIGQEKMAVRSLASTVIQVKRGVDGTPIQAHLSGAAVLVLSPGESPVTLRTQLVAGPIIRHAATTILTTATTATYTMQQLLGGLIIHDPSGGGVTCTLPTAELVLAALQALIGDVPHGAAFDFTIRNNADAAETITMAAGTGGTLSAAGQSTTTSTIVQNASRTYRLVMTNVNVGSAAYTCFSLVSGTH